MSEATVRSSIKTLIDGVSNIGQTYDIEPFADTWDVFLDRFKTTISSTPMIRGWTISLEATPRNGLVTGGGRNIGNTAEYNHIIRGYQGFDYDTSTETAFLVVVFAVMDALDGGIVSGSVYNADLAQLEVYEPRVFGGTLCHYAQIRQVSREQI